MHCEITREPGRHLAVTRFEADLSRIGDQFGEAFGTVAGFLGRRGIGPTGPAMAHYEVRPDGMTVAAGFVVAQPVEGDETVVPLDLPSREVVTGMHVGPYDRLPVAYDALRAAAEAAGRRLDESAMWEAYLDGPESAPEETRTVVSWPLET